MTQYDELHEVRVLTEVVGRNPEAGTTRMRVMGTDLELDVPNTPEVTWIPVSAAELLEAPCIEIHNFDVHVVLTVKEYDQGQRHPTYGTCQWARITPPVHELITKPDPWWRVINTAAYEVQMSAWLGLLD